MKTAEMAGGRRENAHKYVYTTFQSGWFIQHTRWRKQYEAYSAQPRSTRSTQPDDHVSLDLNTL